MTLNIEVLPRVPAQVYGEDGVTVAKSNGALTIGFDYESSGLGADLAQAVDAASTAASSAANAQSAAEAAQAAAEAAAGSLSFATQQEAEEGTITDAGMNPKLTQYSKLGVQTADSMATAQGVNISTLSTSLVLQGRDSPGDGPALPFVSRLSEPSHAGKVLNNGVWYELERHDGVYLEDFGGKNNLQEDGDLDFTHDNITALTDAIDYCKIKRRALIRINSGVWSCKSGGVVLPVGINLVGHGHSSSQLQGGSVLMANYDETTPTNFFLNWDGSGQAFNATGGGAHALTIMKGAAKSGGTLIRLDAVDDTNRPGYMSFTDLKVSGTNQGADCDYCIIHDGSNLTSSNSQGLRDVHYGNVWIDGWVTEGAQFINATHAQLIGFTASPTGSNLDAVRITGNDSSATSKTTDLMAVGLKVYGNIILDNCHECVVVGRTSDLVVTANCTKTRFYGIVDTGVVTFSGTDRAGAMANGTYIHDGPNYGPIFSGSNQVVGARATGWAAATGTATRSAFATSTATTQQVAERLKALIDDLTTHGLIGA